MLLLLLLIPSVIMAMLSTNPEPFYSAVSPNSCYFRDGFGKSANITIVTGEMFRQKYRTRQKKRMNQLFSVARIIWKSQLNVDLFFHILNVSYPVTDECNVIKTQSELYKYHRRGFLLYISGCYSGLNGYAGVAVVGSLCQNQIAVATNDPLDVAHELGHVFGAQHSFENGVGTTGGIMDYGLGLVPGGYGFHESNKRQLCSYINRATCLLESIGNCSNFVIEPGEDCECMDGSMSCGRCVHCRTSSQCSVRRFLKRPPLWDGYLSVAESDLGRPGCCHRGKIKVGGVCGEGFGVCSVVGTCQRLCSLYSYLICGNSPCSQQCWVNGKCVGLYNSLTGESLTNLEDGAPCKYDKSRVGMCKSGKCELNYF